MYKSRNILRIFKGICAIRINSLYLWLGYLLATNFAVVPTTTFMRMTNDLGVAHQLFEPAILLGSAKWDSMFLFLGLIVSMSDAPFVTELTNSIIMRSARKRWMLSNILYIFVSCLVYYCVSNTVIIVVSFQNAYIGNIWSGAMMYATTNVEATSIYQLSFPSVAFLKQFTPVYGFLCTLLCQTLYGFSLMLLLFLLNLMWNRAFGVAAAIVVHAFGNIVILESMTVSPKLSLLLHSLPAYHNVENSYDRLPTIFESLLLFSIIIIVLITFALIYSKHYDFKIPNRQV